MLKQANFGMFLSVVFLLTISLIITSCGSDRAPAATANNNPPNNNSNLITDNSGADNVSADATSEPANLNPQQRIVLKNASLTLTVQDPAQTVNQITQLAEGAGGWVVNSNTTGAEYSGNKVAQGTISVRVPADKFLTVLDQIKASAVSVDSETITGEDVTQKYVDLNGQLTN